MLYAKITKFEVYQSIMEKFTFPFVTDPLSVIQVLPKVTSYCDGKTENVTANVSETGGQSG